jgi:hypothetical protein
VIGTLNESPLHAALKHHYARPGDCFEVPLEGFVIDLVRGQELVEVQTGSFFPLRPKLERLLDFHPMRIVHPIPAERRIVRLDAQGKVLSSRKSPLKGQFLDVFEHLVSFPTLLTHPNFKLDVLLCREEQHRGPRREKTRHLIEIVDRLELTCASDVAALIPTESPFTTAGLASALHCTRALAQRFVYCLKALEVVYVTRKEGRTPVYALGVKERKGRQ